MGARKKIEDYKCEVSGNVQVDKENRMRKVAKTINCNQLVGNGRSEVLCVWWKGIVANY